MVPVIALVGRPNVGKSTLFNRLTRTKNALVADFPGLTRDRKYGKAQIGTYEYIIVDTGGIDSAETESLEHQMVKQTFLAIKEADIVLFMVDAKVGVMPGDYEIATHLRKRQKLTVLVVNKVDGLDVDTVVSDFYVLGIEAIYPIAASHGSGLSLLIKRVLLPIHDADNQPKSLDETSDQPAAPIVVADLPIKVAIVGRPNAGKSTLINRILGEDRVIVYDMPGTTRDSIEIPINIGKRDYILIDTAGVRKRGKVTKNVEKFSVVKTLKAIDSANVVLLVVDAREGLSDQDLSLLRFIINSGKALLIAINKWDGLSSEIKTEIKSVLESRLRFIDFVRIHFISALRGNGVNALFKSINEAYDCATKRVNASLLTKVVQMAQADHQPPLVRGRRIKLKYAHPGGYNPPIVVIHGNQVEALPDSYKRYLINYYRRVLGIIGSPIQIHFKESDNPYQNRKNTLSASQLCKRRRLMKYVKKRK